MKLKTGKARYEIPPHSQILDVSIRGNQKHNQMVDYRLINRPLDYGSPTLTRGFPLSFSIGRGRLGRDTIEFYPIPDHPYEAMIRFVPPVQVI